MQKTKLGVSVGLMGAAMYFFGLFGGVLVTTLSVAYILLFEENPWLKRTALKAEVLMMLFSIIYALIGLLPEAIDMIDYLLRIFKTSFSIFIIDRIETFLKSFVSVVETVMFLLLGLRALSQGNVSVPVVDNAVNKNMNL